MNVPIIKVAGFILPLTTAMVLLVSCREQSEHSIPGFEINPAFQLSLAAAEPLVFDPVDMEFDENGHTYVLEMPGYPLRDEDSRIIRLIDTDEDGIYDERIIYADSLGVASSFMPYEGGMLVAAPPHLIYVKDTNEDGKVDVRENLMSGFSAGNLQHNFNGLTYGLDNWIYAANGGNSGKPYFNDNTDEIFDLRGDDFKFRLNPNVLQLVGESSGGFELAFDDWGHLFETHNLEHISHLVFEGRYQDDVPASESHALSNVSDHEEGGLSRIYPIGEQETRVNHPEQSGYFSGACGITHYGGEAFHGAYNDMILVADCVLNLIHADQISPSNASFEASRIRQKVEFLACDDRAFRPVNLATGPDGALYVIDMHRDVIEHPEWIPDEIEVNLDLKAGRDQGRIYRIEPISGLNAPSFSLDRADIHSLVKSLGHPNQWVRMTAQRLLVEINETSSVDMLKSMVKESNSPLARMHALWTLDGINELDDQLLASTFTDPSHGVVEQAIKIAESRLDSNIDLLDALIDLHSVSNGRVRMQMALTLSTLSESLLDTRAEAIHQALLSMLSQDLDLWQQMAYAATAIQLPASFMNAHFQALAQPDNESKREILMILGRSQGKSRDLEAISNTLASLVKNESSVEYLSILITSLEQGTRLSNQAFANQEAKKQLEVELSLLEEKDDPSISKASAMLRKACGLPLSEAVRNLLQESADAVVNTELLVEERLEYLRLIALEDFNNRQELLYALLNNNQPIQLQNEAIRQLRDERDSDIGVRLIELWPTFGPETRKHAGDILLYNKNNHNLLLTALEDGSIRLGELNLDLERRRILLFWTDNDEIKQRAEALFSDAGVVTRKEAMDKMKPALALSGQVEPGQEVYETHCSQCHQYGELGIEVGPVLTEISRKSKESLLHDIVDPNAAVDSRYLNYQVKTTDGRIVTGMIERETDNEVSLKMMGGTEVVISKSDIEEFSSLGISYMMEGLEGSMTTQNMADLLAFLQQSI